MLILLVSYYTYAYLSSKGKADAEEPDCLLYTSDAADE